MSRLAARPRVAAGLVLVAIALVSAALGRAVAGTQHHAYDPNAAPQTTYQLKSGTVYQLSAPDGVAGLQKLGLLENNAEPQCFAARESTNGSLGVPAAVTLLSTKDDDRDLHVFATFQIGTTGRYQLSCTSIRTVFVDDAEDSEPGYTSALVVLAVLAGVIGVGLALSGLAESSEPDWRGPQAREQDRLTG